MKRGSFTNTEAPGLHPILVIELAGGPGAGKSTLAAALFNLFKSKGERVELVTEVAKDFTYSRRWDDLSNQLLVFAKQDARIRRLVGQVDIVITDSPVWLGLVYAEPGEYGAWFSDALWARWAQYHTRTFFVNRVKEYHAYGRNQTEAEAKALDAKIIDCIYGKTDLMQVNGDSEAPWIIAGALGFRAKWELREEGRDVLGGYAAQRRRDANNDYTRS